MVMLKTIQREFEVETREIAKKDYDEVRLRKGFELDNEKYDDIMNRIPKKYLGSTFFEGGKSLTLALEKYGENYARVVGIVIQKEGIIRNEKMKIFKSVWFDHPAVTHCNATCAEPEEEFCVELGKIVEKIPDFKMRIVEQPSFGKMRMRLEGDAWIGGIFENEEKRKLSIRHDGEGRFTLRYESEGAHSSTDITYRLVGRREARLKSLRINKPPWAEGVEIDMWNYREKMQGRIESGKAVRSIKTFKDEETFELKEGIKGYKGEFTARHYIDRTGKVWEISIAGPDETVPVIIHPGVVIHRFNKFLGGEAAVEWVAKWD